MGESEFWAEKVGRLIRAPAVARPNSRHWAEVKEFSIIPINSHKSNLFKGGHVTRLAECIFITSCWCWYLGKGVKDEGQCRCQIVVIFKY